MQRINDLDDPRVRPFQNLKERDLGDRFIAEGRALEALLQSPLHRAQAILLSDKRASDARWQHLTDQAGDTPIYLVDQPLMNRLVGFPVQRGELALGIATTFALKTILDKPGPQKLLVLEDIANHSNVGAMFRSAAALGADAVLLSPHCASPLYRRALQASVGASLRLPFVRLPDWPGALDALEGAGFLRVGLAPKAPADSMQRFLSAPPARLALLAGTEGTGLSNGALKRCDQLLSIPMSGGMDSLNVGTALGIALFAAGLRQTQAN